MVLVMLLKAGFPALQFGHLQWKRGDKKRLSAVLLQVLNRLPLPNPLPFLLARPLILEVGWQSGEGGAGRIWAKALLLLVLPSADLALIIARVLSMRRRINGGRREIKE